MKRPGRIPPVSGAERERRRPYGRLAVLAVALIVLAAGAWFAHRSLGSFVAGGVPLLPDGVTPREASRTGERFIGGLMDGAISPEAGVQIISRLLMAADDGVLTGEEIGRILEQMRHARGMNL
jgi:hypothetical protein